MHINNNEPRGNFRYILIFLLDALGNNSMLIPVKILICHIYMDS